MKTSIFIRTYPKDIDWLEYCLRSLKKRAVGFHEVVVGILRNDEKAFANFNFGDVKVVRLGYWCFDQYIQQQADKMLADNFCEGDYIVHVDSDCFSTRIWSPDELFHEGKPRMLKREWKGLGHAECWQEPTRWLLGVNPPYETMATHPMIHERGMLKRLRAHIEKHHGKKFDDIIRSMKELSEFNAVGNYVLCFEPETYHCVFADMANDGYPRPLKQHYSHSRVTPELRAEFEESLK